MLSAFKDFNVEIKLFFHEKIYDFPCNEFDEYFDSLVAEAAYTFCLL